MIDESIILSKSPIQTRLCGSSLASTLYALPVTIALTGELGAGKTTFLQGFSEALGVVDAVTSPTYALEQHYETPRGPLLHLDLYRLTEAQARELLAASDDFPGIRCIEWFDRIGVEDRKATSFIHIHLEGEQNEDERLIHCTFQDTTLFSDVQIAHWRHEVHLPTHITAHCDAVAVFCDRLSDLLMERGHLVRRKTLYRAAQMHDLLRFLDFRSGGHPDEPSDEQHARWALWRERFPGLHHEAACAEFLRQEGYPVIAGIVEVHGLSLPPPDRSRTEQKLLFYADKRVQIDRIVTLKERFEDFAKRYGSTSLTTGGGSGAQLSQREMWYEEAKAVEDELFPERVPI